jgi:F-type H+-transporting ATPase subunit b
MTIDPFTFALEIVNFLVLLWLLHRFLYRPIQKAINDRKQALNQEIAAAQQQQQEALALKNQYEESIAGWEREKARQQEALHQELHQEQESTLVKIRQAAEAERVRLQTLTEQDLASRQRQEQSLAAQNALHLTGKMLERLAGSELDQVILRILLEDLERLPEADRLQLQAAVSRKQEPVTVTTARIMSQEEQQRLQAGLSKVLGRDLPCTYLQDPALLSGFRLTIGDQVVQASLSEELAFFGRSLNRESL